MDDVSGEVRVGGARAPENEPEWDIACLLEADDDWEGPRWDIDGETGVTRRVHGRSWNSDAETGVTRRVSHSEVESERKLRSDSERARQLLEPLRESDSHDLLTGLLNWGHFAMSLHVAAADARRNRSALSLILVEIDYLERIHVHHGSQEVTRLLVEVAAICLREVTETQVIGRFGQCRVGVLLADHTCAQAARIAERLRTLVRHQVCFGTELPVTLSAGCASLQEASEPSTGDLLDLAEQRLEEAAQSGGNQVVAAGRFWQDNLL